MAVEEGKLLSALSSLRGNHNFEVVVEFMRSELSDSLDALVKQSDIDMLRITQGKARFLNDLLYKADNAEEIIRKINGRGIPNTGSLSRLR